jgi:Ca2+-binding RTX toxin-like protein
MSDKNISGLIGSNIWSGKTISYTYLGFLPSYYNSENPTEIEFQSSFVSNFPIKSKIANAVYEAFKQITAVTGLAFSEVLQTATSVGDIVFGAESKISIGGATQSGATITTGNGTTGDVFFSTGLLNSTPQEINAAVLHEILHALGLGHPSANDSKFRADGLTFAHTAMMPNSDTSGLGLYDIEALQYLYGTNHNNNSGDTIYDVSNANFLSIWDTGGNDTISIAGRFDTYGGLIDLRQGFFSLASGTNLSVHNVSIAFDVIIENATGSIGNDVLIGNDQINKLVGGAGDDHLYGDSYVVGVGNAKEDVKSTVFVTPPDIVPDQKRDILNGGDGNDRYYLSHSVSFNDAAGEAVLPLIDHIIDSDGLGQIILPDGTEVEKIQWRPSYYGFVDRNADEGWFGYHLTTNGKMWVFNYGDGRFETTSYCSIDIPEIPQSSSKTIATASLSASNPYFLGMVFLNLLNQVPGTIGADNLVGSVIADYVTGLAGNDTVNAGDGNDYIDGGDGVDTLHGNNGDDDIAGDADNDQVFGDAGNDTLRGGSGNDTLDGGSGTDTLYLKGARSDYTFSSISATQVQVVDQLSRRDGTDIISSIEKIRFSDGEQDLQTILGGGQTVNGTNGDDNLLGTSGNDVISGLGGDDVLNGGLGVDILLGGTGNDLFVVDTSTDTITEFANEGTDTVLSSVTLAALPANVENLILSGTSAINGSGNALSNSITGNTANNVLAGGAGNDILNGLAGIDTLVGGTGDDIYIVDSTTDIITELGNEGIDTLQSSVSVSALAPNIENLILTVAMALNGTGNSLDNIITGNTANNTLNGGAGNDVLIGGFGDDILNGGAGDDTLNGGVGADLLVGGLGADTASYASATAAVGVHMGSTTVNYGEAVGDQYVSIENLIGSDFDDELILTAGDNIAKGGNGSDQISALAGNDTLLGEGGDDALYASLGNDTLFGGTGNDLLFADEGVDRLEGGMGNDYLVGGTGSDTFVFKPNFGFDTISDFEAGSVGTDMIEISALGVSNFATLRNLMSESGGNTYIDFADGSELKLSDVTISQLIASDFIFV